VNSSALWNSSFHGKLGIVLGLVFCFKKLYGETYREVTGDHDREIQLKDTWKDVEKVIKSICVKFLVLYP
jgi:hypothetical protein